MKVTIDREILLERLEKCIKYVPKKAIIPATSNFAITFQDNTMSIYATDTHVEIMMECPVQMDLMMAQAICIPAKLFTDTVKAFKYNEIILSAKEKKVELKCGNNKYNIVTDCEFVEFPRMQLDTVLHNIVIRQNSLKQTFSIVERFLDEKATIDNLNGINIKEIDNNMVITGANRFVMCRAQVKPLSITSWQEITITPECCEKVYRQLEDKGEVSISHLSGKVVFESVDSPVKFIVKATIKADPFPNTEMIFNKPLEHSAVVNAQEMADLMDRMYLFCDPDDAVAKINSEEDLSQLSIRTSNKTMGHDAHETITIKDCLIPIKINLNVIFLKIILKNIEQAEVDFRYTDSKTQVMIEPKGSDEEKMFKFIISSVV